MASIQDQLDDLRRDVGDFTVHQDLTKPPAELPNGDYPVAFRQHQIGVAIDDCVTRVNALSEVVATFDARLKALESAPAGSTDVLAVLRANNVFLSGGRMGLGGEPVQDTDAKLTIYGGQILGKNVGNWQNPNAVIENVWDIANSDAGMRALQNVRYFNGKKIVPQPTRPVNPDDLSQGTEANPYSISAIFDSHGEPCISDERVPYGQVFYIRKDFATKTITLAAFQVGWKIQLRESSAYGAADIPAKT